ncbi:hypothetical protein F0562_035828 [Nyssa sinensis]|uniref:Small EDRK-rich factor-like N-terminal domain-containing protein n=1 Tax=Nyssa sinensis TaxID=561372 RepID=A0A5J5AC13_9ASTE|nr:hypothetical protein F0562_035828 [Nyssa sinensis]
MGGGNGQKAKMAREKNLEKNKPSKGSQLDSNKKAMSIQCKVCMQTFICTTSENLIFQTDGRYLHLKLFVEYVYNISPLLDYFQYKCLWNMH